MKIKENLELLKKIIKSSNMVVFKCPYCNSLDIKYYKDTLTEEIIMLKDHTHAEKIKYKISCNECNGYAEIDEFWVK